MRLNMYRTILSMRYVGVVMFLMFNLNVYPQSWITSGGEGCDKPNTWIEFTKTINIDKPKSTVDAKIGADTKYWLWINDSLAVFEGGLKRGPNPNDSYYDKVILTPFLRDGENRIKVLLWYFGKDGFSHKDSGRSAFIFDASDIGLVSDSTWLSRRLSAYQTVDKHDANYRLAESNIRYDANLTDKDEFSHSKEIGKWGEAPWNGLIERPIPQWKRFDVRYCDLELKSIQNGMTIYSMSLPYNMQFTPLIEVDDYVGGHLIRIETDHVKGGGADCVRAEYVTRPGPQQYESLGWMNGERLYIIVEDTVDLRINKVGYRETGYDSDFKGYFTSNDPLIDRFWKKAMRTLYVNMRDNYFDCPDRERAQWWGDVTVLMGQSFYQLSPSANALMKKAIKELVDWQKPDGTLFSPIPAGNWDAELPAQMLASIGRYGFWTYYLHTGDKETIAYVYPSVKRYLSLWTLDETGLTNERKGGWSWGDWGADIDLRLLLACWHYMALDAAVDMARLIGEENDVDGYLMTMAKIKEGFERNWNGSEYRHPTYQGATDDRVQAMAVLSGLADEEKYDGIVAVLKTQSHASPYMEKYVLETLMRLNQGEYALGRFKERFTPMINDPEHTTLYEGWEEGGYGGGSTNHAWSGGMLTVIAENVCGVRPLAPGWELFEIAPYPVLSECSIGIPTVKGLIESSFSNSDDEFRLSFSVAEGSKCRLRLPSGGYSSIKVNGKSVKVGAIGAKEFDPGAYEVICEY